MFLRDALNVAVAVEPVDDFLYIPFGNFTDINTVDVAEIDEVSVVIDLEGPATSALSARLASIHTLPLAGGETTAGIASAP